MTNHENENSITDQFIEHFGLRDKYGYGEGNLIDRVKDVVKIKKWKVEWEVDWIKFRELEPSPDRAYNDQLHGAAVNLLEKAGVLSMEQENNYEFLLKRVAGGYVGPSVDAIGFYFTRRKGAEAYAKVRWGSKWREDVSIVHYSKE